MKDKKIAVISSGNGGQAMAGYFSNLGYRVALYVREQERVDMFKSNDFVVGGAVECTTEIDLISCNMDEVIEGAYLIMVTTPSQYHSIVAKAMAPYLKDGQMVILNPGRTLGSYEFDKVLSDNGCTADITLGETETFIFTCRCLKLGHPIIYSIKTGVEVAAHKPERTPLLVEALSELFPGIHAAKSTLHTGFCNIGMIFHPLPILMNITRVEAKEGFLFYMDGISPLVANILERLDKERVSVAKALGVDVLSAYDWLYERYGSEGENLYERIQNTKAYATVLAPTDIDTRYIFEDIRTGCVPVSCAGKKLGVDTYIVDSVIQWASTVYDFDFMSKGRNDRYLDFERIMEDAKNIAKQA